MKKLIIFVVIFCIRFGFSGGTLRAQTTTDFINDGTTIVKREIKIVEKYPSPTKDADPLGVVKSINNRTPYVVHSLENTWAWRMRYIDTIYMMDYQTNTWKKPITQILYEDIVPQKILFGFCVVIFFPGLFFGKILRRKSNSFVLIFIFSLIYLFCLDYMGVYVYMGINYNDTQNFSFIPSSGLFGLLTGALWLGILFNKLLFKKKIQNLTDPMGLDS